MKLTPKTVGKRCKLWQERLRLSDWKVVVKIVKRSEMVTQDSLAECAWNLERKRADVHLLDTRARTTDENPDMEADLVHELLHLHFAPFWDHEDNNKAVPQEQAIDIIAEALVAAYRSE